MDELTAAEKADIELVDGHSDDLADSVEKYSDGAFWVMNWGDRYPDKLAQEQMCEKHTALGIY